MFKLDDNLLIELGLGTLPPVEKNRMLSHIYETLEMRVGMKLAQKMTNEQLNEFEAFIDRSDEAGALKWLETNFPDYKQVVANELETLKGEIKTAAPQIVAASQQQAAMQPAQPVQQPQQFQQPQQPQPTAPPQYPVPPSSPASMPYPQDVPTGFSQQPQQFQQPQQPQPSPLQQFPQQQAAMQPAQPVQQPQQFQQPQQPQPTAPPQYPVPPSSPFDAQSQTGQVSGATDLSAPVVNPTSTEFPQQ